ncbi:MAG: peptide chain release factor N(5)-glutamine methyltransferase [Zetaproteobacteria bacterium]|nr:peptide chain release factor N(5)-glutamine methyltransferase [Zetaproteobacteria bacterium]
METQNTTIGDLLQDGFAYLKQYNLKTKRALPSLVVHILSSTSGISKTKIIGFPELEVPQIAITSYCNALARYSQGEPIELILGEASFDGHMFQVTPDTLIPRPDSEIVLNAAHEKAHECLQSTGNVRLLDIGTGSGILAITLSLRLTRMVEAWDISSAALEVAKANQHRLGAHVTFHQHDAFTLLPSYEQARTFDVIVSNPPYIGEHERAALDTSVIDFEPEIALFAQNDGLAFYQLYAAYAQDWLSPQGWLCVEIGWKQAGDVEKIFQQHGWQNIQCIQDLGARDRTIIAQKP